MSIPWIAADWGTSNLRLWAMDEKGSVLAEKVSDQGMAKLAPEAFEGVLLDLCADWLSNEPIPVIACGMVGARQGWCEVPYGTIPSTKDLNTHLIENTDPRLIVHIVWGLKQDSPADVMRGEETQIAGFVHARNQAEGLLCLPGTHTKWVTLNEGSIAQFRTVMMGEIFALVSEHSVLRHSMVEFDEKTFTTSVQEATKNPKQVMVQLFEIRARHLLHDDQRGRARLSGLLIGLELAGTINYWQGAHVNIIGESSLSRYYALALTALGNKAQIWDSTSLTLGGLRSVYERLYS